MGMTDAEELLLQDAIETSLKAHYRLSKCVRVVFAMTIMIAVLIGIIFALIVGWL